MSAPRHRVLVVDDHPLFRKGAAELIAMSSALELAGEASSGEEGVRLARSLAPDVILLDLNMKGMDGLTTLRTLRAEGVRARIVVLTVSDHEGDIVEAMRAGADGYLLKDAEPEEILEHLHRVIEGHMAVSDEVTRILVGQLRRGPEPAAPEAARLTAREREVLRLLARGLSNKTIALRLGISDATVKVYVKGILRKLGLRSRTEAAVWAAQHGLDGTSSPDAARDDPA
ncbi:two-component system response regulator NarL [Inmirania thermothiophila]|uniref:LuxR family two component transcriptional regulator n=1 Tax=Inmirania thermothiophila TaxID=1750597 RepID=A0A3N1Y0Q7_9GAMM|nr:two-component system response regulator NarL [Inmirania thermothiophila]ROR32419.1 LuxR family two component transcriptional regulator [Inmirania thermothiophila]